MDNASEWVLVWLDFSIIVSIELIIYCLLSGLDIADGNWSYTLDKPMEDGNHEVYVAVNDNAGKVIAKSTPLPFVQTAEAATVTYPKNLASPDRAPAPTRSRLWEGYLIFFMAGLGGLVLVLIAIGFAKNSRNE